MSQELSPTPRPIRRLVGVYNANGTVRGELGYFIGARLGRAHCALCDITHGLVRERPAWESCRAGLPVPFDTYHRDDQPSALRHAYDTPPVVVAELDAGFVVLLGPKELAECHGSVDMLMEAIERAVIQTGLTWPE